MPGEVSRSYDGPGPPDDQADVYDALRGVLDQIGGVLLDRPLVNIVEVARGPDGQQVTCYLAERQLRLIRYALRCCVQHDEGLLVPVPTNLGAAVRLGAKIGYALGLEKPADAETRRRDCIRAAGDVLCSCGLPYRRHPVDPEHPDFLVVLCDLTRVKL